MSTWPQCTLAYDGTFTGTLVEGKGVLAQALHGHGADAADAFLGGQQIPFPLQIHTKGMTIPFRKSYIFIHMKGIDLAPVNIFTAQQTLQHFILRRSCRKDHIDRFLGFK